MPKLRHIKIENGVDFITTCIKNKETIFSNYANARILLDAILFGRKSGWYYLFGFVIMPDHLHIALGPGERRVPSIMQGLKGFSSKKINELHKKSGPVWQRGYRDFYIYKPETCLQKLRYIEENPVRAGLVDIPTKHPFSSAGREELLDLSMLF